MLTDNPILVNCIRETPTLMCAQRKAKKIVPTEEDIIRSNIASFGDDIVPLKGEVCLPFPETIAYRRIPDVVSRVGRCEFVAEVFLEREVGLQRKAEIHFIAMLSANKMFTFLFGNTTYWSANGAIAVSNGNVTDSSVSSALSRCVYDSWYWGDEQQENRTQFVWGDRP